MFDFASRIAKLDAVSLDNEFLSFLKREITGLLASFTNEETLQRFLPEVTLLVKFVIWKFTTSSTQSTLGQKLLGIKYAHVPGKLKLLFILEGVIPYAIERLNSLRETPPLQQIRKPLRYAESVCKILSVINFCMFLVQNRYPTLATRILALPIVSISRRTGSPGGYTYQIRELLWHQFADFLITILPLINFQKLKRSVTQLVLKRSPVEIGSTVENISSTKENNLDNNGASLLCAVCKEDAIIPHKVGSEYFCYFCYQGVFDERL